jgi:LacI family transcriptional regulator
LEVGSLCGFENFQTDSEIYVLIKQKQAGVKDVAKLAQVSLGTVSHVLNHPERVTTETRNKVLAAIEELRFTRNNAASQLRAGRRTAIGLVIPDIANPFFSEVARGVEDEADARGYTVLLCNAAESEVRQQRHLQFLQEERVSGVLLTPVDNKNVGQATEPLLAAGQHVVLIDQISRHTDACLVAVDDVLGGELAGAHLLNQGATSLVFIGGRSWVRQSRDRLSGLRDAVAKNNAKATITVLEVEGLGSSCGYKAGEEMLITKPDAIFCANDLLALGVMRRFLENHVRIPTDVRLMGYDDIDFAGSAAVPLSSIRQPAYQLGRTSASLLFAEVNDVSGEHLHQQILFRPELVVRSSTVGQEGK